MMRQPPPEILHVNAGARSPVGRVLEPRNPVLHMRICTAWEDEQEIAMGNFPRCPLRTAARRFPFTAPLNTVRTRAPDPVAFVAYASRTRVESLFSRRTP
jgi:hypothetical protein